MLDSESKFEKVQGIWFDDIDWSVEVGYMKVDDSGDEEADEGCVYLVNGGYAYGCKKVTKGRGESQDNGTAFQRRLGKERNKLKKTGWGLKIGMVSFVKGLVELVKNGGSSERENFESKWEKWFERGKGNDCLVVNETKRGEGTEESYSKKNCKWRLKDNKKNQITTIFKKVFADEKGWALKSFRKEDIDKLCRDKGWSEHNFGKNGKSVMEKVKKKFQNAHCRGGKSNYGERGDGYVDNWDVSGDIKVIEGHVYEFGRNNGGSADLLAFEKMGEGQDIFEEAKGKGGRKQITAGDWLKAAKWDGNLAEQSCHSVEQWETRDSGVSEHSNQCVKNKSNNEGGKWLNDQKWENIKERFGLMKSSDSGNCQWLMKKPFKGSGHEDLRPEHTMVMDFGLVLSLITNNEICR
ncbi:hypothetical protein MSUIS_06480 [Mycoplasma suis KI3806]|uniref:Uncharacterized protein n=1 Tax=Mycoplasma suis (strain KI_3806) TaxID=708248 RepID=F0V260_MYCS3|nr:hypothetical protein [Mycoplasma suis]CBZ40741.1 hypothetical protein MSUIS_06480 [Mycoplasma suis KI3806]